MYDSAVLRDLLILTKDGEWGKGEPSHDLLEMLVIRGADFNEARFCDLKNIPVRFIPKHIAERKQLQPEDILIETAGGTKDRPTGRTVFLKSRLFRNSSKPITCASFSRFLRIDKSRAFPEYVFWYLQYLYKNGQMEQHQVQHTGVARFQYTKFAESIVIPLPPLPEQRAIASILGTLDDKIELNRRMNETLEAIARAIFKSWFVDFDPVRAKAEGREPADMDAETAALFPDSFEETELGMVPKGWVVKTIGDIMELVYGKALKEECRKPGKVPVFGSNGQVGWHNETLADGPGIVVGRKGNPGIVTWSQTDFFSIDTTFYVLPKDPCMSMYYLLYGLRNQDLASLGADSAVPGLNRNLAYMSKMLVPSVMVLEAFNKCTAILHKKIHANNEQSHNISAIRDALLPKLVTGELMVADGKEVVRTS